MSLKELLEMVVNGEELTEEEIATAQKFLDKEAKREEKEAERKAQRKAENDNVKQEILDYIAEQGGKSVLASQVGTALNISTQKASALLIQLRTDDLIENSEPYKRTLTYVLKEN